MTFSWIKAIKHGEEVKIRRAKIQAKISHPDFTIKHPGEVRDAKTGNYTVLIKRVKEEVQQQQKLAITRRTKNVQN